MRARALVAIVGATAVLVVLPTAGAATAPAVANGPDRVALTGASTVPQIKTYLRSLGLDPARAVIQRGARNYAGPNCPGANWNCTSASLKGLVVVQVSRAGQNTSVCDPEAESEGPASLYFTPTESCFVSQFSETGKNQATCRQSTDADPAVLSCDVTQVNVSGDNHADIDQRVRQTTGATQVADVVADLDQENESGNNHANLSQAISQSTLQVENLEQSQDAEFDAMVDQDTEEGSNHLQQSQTLDQDGRASGPSTIVQSQSADHDGSVDQSAGVSEKLALSRAGAAGPDGGFSKAHVIQSERQTLTGPGTQNQFGPMNCCGSDSQTGGPQQTQITIQQSSTQRASQLDEGTATQAQRLDGDCYTTGTCTITHNVSNEADSRNERVSGTGFQTLTTVCFAGCEGGFCSDGEVD